jgi:penicillin-binding protein 1C
VGNFDGRGNPVFTGRESAAPLLFSLVDALQAESKIPGRKTPPKLNVANVRICPVSGRLPGPHCKRLAWTSFIPGRSPIQQCDVHREVWIDQRSGRRTCHPEPGYAVAEVFEFWPSDVLRLFRAAGVARRTPPPLDGSCPLDDRASRGAAPEITSPVKDLTYLVRVNRKFDGSDRIPLSAVVDADASLVHWFAGERYLGRTLPSEPLFWNPQPGRFTLRAVDDHGRSAYREVEVRAEE